ncbi:MAG: hypothetical protein RMK57_05145 [Bryobacterales bacterium]|nr:hypothetical protein [Bryobacteraceae bacterium]MDW8353900.1 hypothetical protein [Bryobacterales bacterium]
MQRFLGGLVALAWGGLGAVELSRALAEPNLEKRSRLALENAEAALRRAAEAYQVGQWDATLEALEEVRKSVEVSYLALKATGKNPRRSPRHFKHAEQRTRNLLRRLRDLRQKFSIEERQHIDAVEEYIRKVHDELLGGILGTVDWSKT